MPLTVTRPRLLLVTLVLFSANVIWMNSVRFISSTGRARTCISELNLLSDGTSIARPFGDKITDVFGFEIVGGLPDAGQQSLPESTHHFREDGLLEVNPDGPHPIFELMDRAEERWSLKNKRASRNLKSACKEYEQRYGRKPPRGFDVWWTYTQLYNVSLPDEYDQIAREMEPFWGVDPLDVQKAQLDWESKTDGYTVGKLNQDDDLSVLASLTNDTETSHLKFALPLILETLEEVHTFIPPFRATINPHDSPTLLRDVNNHNLVLQAAKEGRTVAFDALPQQEYYGWRSACPRDSPAWTSGIEFKDDLPPLPELLSWSGKPNGTLTFIHNHAASMDPCLHPLHLLLHGPLLGYREWFTDRVEPWLHYIPIQIDYSDLLSALYFFRGDSAGHGAHPDLAKKVADAGREWALLHYRKADMTAYMFRLLLEYARVMDPARANGGLDYIYHEADEWDESSASNLADEYGSTWRMTLSFKVVQWWLKRRSK